MALHRVVVAIRTTIVIYRPDQSGPAPEIYTEDNTTQRLRGCVFHLLITLSFSPTYLREVYPARCDKI